MVGLWQGSRDGDMSPSRKATERWSVTFMGCSPVGVGKAHFSSLGHEDLGIGVFDHEGHEMALLLGIGYIG